MQDKNKDLNSFQTLVLDIGDIKTPLEFKIDQTTDWWALSLTLLVTVIVSIVSAYVTILLVTRSNNNLIKNQNFQNEKQLSKQEEFINKQIISQESQKESELNAHYKQLWMEKLRDEGAQFLHNTSIFSMQVFNNITFFNSFKRSGKGEENVNKHYDQLNQTIKQLEISQIKIQLSLNSNNELDNEIIELMAKIIIIVKSLSSQAYEELTNKINYKNINYENLASLPEHTSLMNCEILIKKKFIELLREERTFMYD
ncbi:hypothetical protein [Acinetobacter courvalinii]|uniref:Transmembrane protein n=1 Tax=Acinetobacter courvalinii TaxID=280147 RepID=A0AA42LEI1_9GAMM|nr:hypothetical protein [Acinetobacter courvalinii]MDH0563785.1 hypothetical protein [Acinetobacter courvalinii]